MPLPAVVRIPVGGYAQPLTDQLFNATGQPLDLNPGAGAATVILQLADPTGVVLHTAAATVASGHLGQLTVAMPSPVLDADYNYAAWYLVTFPTALPYPTAPFQLRVAKEIDDDILVQMPALDWAPSVKDVADWLQLRTFNDNGVSVGTFVDDASDGTGGTRPTYSQVLRIVGQGYSEVQLAVGSDPPAILWDSAKRLAAIYSAMIVEITYFPGDINTSSSPYNQLLGLYTMGLKELKNAVATVNDDGTLSDGSSGSTVFTVGYTGRDVDWSTRF